MSDILIPIALSSQLDVTGEERIHAAGYSSTIRPSFVRAPQPTFVAVGYGGKIGKTTDGGATWSLISIPGVTTSNLIRVRYVNGLWVVTGMPDKVHTSPDLASWTTYVLDDVSSPASGPAAIAYGLGTLAIGINRNYYYGQTLPDPTFWQNTLSGTGTSGTQAAYGLADALMFGDNDGKIWETNTLFGWNQRTPGFVVGTDIKQIIHDGTRWVAVGFTNTGGTSMRVATSLNRASWFNRYSTNVDPISIAHGTNSYVLLMNGAKIRRCIGDIDFMNWTGDISNPFSYSLSEVDYGSGTYVAVAEGGQIAHSVDEGATWTSASVNPFTVDDPLYSVAYGVA